jgi:pimeloyl-ACP methyl ester carboxylesterase
MSRLPRLAPLALLVVLFTVVSAARCYEPDTRVIVFIQGVYTNLDEDGTQTSFVEEHRFDALKAQFLSAGYTKDDLLDFSYNGGTVTGDGEWQPTPYDCEDTDREAGRHLETLERMLQEYRAAHPNAHFTLVGHSLGGYLAFLEGAREAQRPDNEKLHVDVVVTVDAPLKGVSGDKAAIINVIPCAKTYEAAAQLAADKADPRTPGIRGQQAAEMATEGVRLATIGNVADCLWNTGRCLPGQTWADDSETQFMDGQAAASYRYDISSGPLESHDVILVHRPALGAIRDFVGAP